VGVRVGEAATRSAGRQRSDSEGLDSDAPPMADSDNAPASQDGDEAAVA
jgi:hypothetical protein